MSCTFVLTTQPPVSPAPPPRRERSRPRARHLEPRPPSPAAFRAARPAPRLRAPRPAAPPARPRGGPPFPAPAGWRPSPRGCGGPRGPAGLAAPRPLPPPRSRPLAPSRGTPARRSWGRLRALPGIIRGQIGEERHQLVRRGGRHAGHLVDVLPLQVENIVQRAESGGIEDPEHLGGEPLELRERHLGDAGFLLLERRQGEERAFAAPLQPFPARIEIDLPDGPPGGEPHA